MKINPAFLTADMNGVMRIVQISSKTSPMKQPILATIAAAILLPSSLHGATFFINLENSATGGSVSGAVATAASWTNFSSATGNGVNITSGISQNFGSGLAQARIHNDVSFLKGLSEAASVILNDRKQPSSSGSSMDRHPHEFPLNSYENNLPQLRPKSSS